MHMCAMTHAYVCHDSCICVTWLMHMCDMTRAHVWHDSGTCVTWLIHMCGINVNRLCAMTHAHVWHDPCICVTWLMHMCDMTHAYVWHDSCICVTWLRHMCDMTHAYVWHDLCTCVTWLNRLCAMTHAQVWHDLYICVTWLIRMCGVTHAYLRLDSFIHSYVCAWDHQIRSPSLFWGDVTQLWTIHWRIITRIQPWTNHHTYAAINEYSHVCRSDVPDICCGVLQCVAVFCSVWARHFIHIHVYAGGMSHIFMSEAFHSYMGHDSSDMGHYSFIYRTWLIHMWSFIFVTRLVFTCDMTQAIKSWHDPFMCVEWLMLDGWRDSINMCDITHSYVGLEVIWVDE